MRKPRGRRRVGNNAGGRKVRLSACYPGVTREVTKTLTIKIKPAEKALSDFRSAFKALESGRQVRRREGVYFASIEAARNFLTPNRLALLLRAIRTERPNSIYQLAKKLNRDLKNVQEDLRLVKK